MLYYLAALLVYYALFRLFAPAHAQAALGRARVADWAVGGFSAAMVALVVML